MIDETTDLDACFSTADFAEEVTIAGIGTVNGIFNKPSDVSAMFDVDIDALQPSVWVKSHEIVGLTVGATVNVRGTNYTFVKPGRVGTGITVLYLKT